VQGEGKKTAKGDDFKMTSYSSTSLLSAPSIPKDFLSLAELTPSEFKSLLDLADAFKAERERKSFQHQVPGTSLALLFEKPSTRTRVSFEVATFELGGHAVVLNSREMQSSRGESPEDTARVLSGFCHAIAARVFSHETLEKFSRVSTVPVINALSDLYHPCQALADFQTVRQYKGKLKGLKIAWIGDGDNVCNSLMIAAALAGSDICVASPKKYWPLPEALALARQQADVTHSEITVVESAQEAANNADVVVTDTFVSMGQDSEKEERLSAFLPSYQVNDELMGYAKPGAIFMHCLPAHRGEEVEASIIDGPQSVVWREAENRLHSQKALLYCLLKKNSRSSKR
jgi:ornithine carbamoyltransferase